VSNPNQHSDEQNTESAGTQSSPLKLPLPFDPGSALISGSKAVPAVRYAVGVVGVCAAAAIATSFFNRSLRTPAVATVVLLALMFFLWVFSRLVALAKDDLRPAMLVLTWAFLILTVSSVALVLSSTFFRYPRPLPDIVGDLLDRPKSNTNTNPSLPEDKPKPTAPENQPSQPKNNEEKQAEVQRQAAVPASRAKVRPDSTAHDNANEKRPSANVVGPSPATNVTEKSAAVSASIAPASNVPTPPQQSLSDKCPRPQSATNSPYSAIPDEATPSFGSVEYGKAAVTAYKKGDYNWSCYLVLRQRRFSSLFFWRDNQAYLAGALYKLGDEADGQQQLHSLLTYAGESKVDFLLSNYARALDDAGDVQTSPVKEEFKRTKKAILDHRDSLSE